jgi:chorismate mutase
VSVMLCRGVRAATTVENDTREEILAATRELLTLVIETNGIEPDDVASAIFTTTPDLSAEYPALAARQLGWHDVALLCGHEMAVPHGLQKCIRILIHWNTTRPARAIEHVYIKGAVGLRPDRVALATLEDISTATPDEPAFELFEDTDGRDSQT